MSIDRFDAMLNRSELVRLILLPLPGGNRFGQPTLSEQEILDMIHHNTQIGPETPLQLQRRKEPSGFLRGRATLLQAISVFES